MGKRIQIIDLLRVLAVFAVVLYHFYPLYFPYGFVGVDIFLVISGFVISKSIRESVSGYNSIHFFRKRLYRLYPNLLFVILLILFIYLLFFPKSLFPLLFKSAFSTLSFFSNYYYGSVSGYFDIVSEINPLLHTWSLSLEWQFYLIIALILSVFKKIKFLDYTVLIMSFISFYLAVYFMYDRPVFNFFSVVTRFFEFGIGFYAYRHIKFFSNFKYSEVFNIFLIFFVLLLFLNFEIKSAFWPNYFSLGLTIIIVLFILVNSKFKINNAVVKNIIFWFSDRSYSIYLIHYPFAAYLKFSKQYNIPLFILSIIILVIILSHYTFVFIESKYRYQNKSLFNIIFIGLILFSSLAFMSLMKIPQNEIDYSLYVKERFLRLNSRVDNLISRKFYIIGDSYSEDFVNILVDGLKFNEDLISCTFIDMDCGNLYLLSNQNYKELKSVKKTCNSTFVYNQVLQNIDDNDILILSSNWSNWTLNYLNQSILNIRKSFKGKIIIVGTKHIGKQSPYFIESLPYEKKINLKSSPPAYVNIINSRIYNITSKHNNIEFFNIQNLLIDQNKVGTVTDHYGNILTYDGGHLTKSGSVYISKKIPKNIINILNAH